MARNLFQKIYTVSELNANIKSLLEEHFPFVWISGEISNFRVPVSGHFYFTLKDAFAQINAVMFRAQQRQLKFEPEDGMSVTGMGRISVYEPRGTYQIILEYLEPSGIGALQVAYEKLKARLAAEGYFDEQHKQPLPFLPQKIAILTSPSGAVIHDMMTIIQRRFAGVQLEIIPITVQGDDAEDTIVAGLQLLNSRSDVDVAIVARGGGSLEDLQAFNSERVAKAIFESRVPVISAIGHETDYTISDFVADYRAPTPSAAAERVVPEKVELRRRCSTLNDRLIAAVYRYLERNRLNLKQISSRVIDPRRKIEDYRLRVDDYSARLRRQILNYVGSKRERLRGWTDRIYVHNPIHQINRIKYILEQINYKLHLSFNIILTDRQAALRELTARLNALNPSAILDRGYSITRTIPEAKVVTDPRMVSLNQDLEVLLAKGTLRCRVKGKSTDGEKDIRTIDETA